MPADQLALLSITVIGVGAIGRQVALQLAAIGAPRLRLVDFDRVDRTNVATQGYWEADVGQLKDRAAAAAIGRLDRSIEAEIVEDCFRPKHSATGRIPTTTRWKTPQSRPGRKRFWTPNL